MCFTNWTLRVIRVKLMVESSLNWTSAMLHGSVLVYPSCRFKKNKGKYTTNIPLQTYVDAHGFQFLKTSCLKRQCHKILLCPTASSLILCYCHTARSLALCVCHTYRSLTLRNVTQRGVWPVARSLSAEFDCSMFHISAQGRTFKRLLNVFCV